MTHRLYLLPLVPNAKGAMIPAYADAELGGVETNLVSYGSEPVCLLAADVTAAQHGALTAHADVTALPADLTQAIGGQLGAVQAALVSLNIPEDWVQGTHTYRQVVRVVATVFLFASRLQAAQVARLFGGTVTLATRFNQLPAGVRTALRDTADSLGIDSTQLSGTMTLRQLLKFCGDSAHLFEIHLGQETV